MLYNKDWDVKPKQDVFSLENLIAWLETKDPDRHYDYTLPQKCVLAQFAKSLDINAKTFGWMSYTVNGQVIDAEPYRQIANGNDAGDKRLYTFGKALERARAELQKQNGTNTI